MPSLPPFSCSFSSEVPDILGDLGCSLILSTYQGGKIILLGPGEDGISQLSRNFDAPMGVAIDGDRLAVATKHAVLELRNAPTLASAYPNKPNHYDALFVPRATYHTGQLDLHDLSFGNDGLIAINTLFSCIAKIDSEFSFKPVWKPSFISDLKPEDRCHLNGLAMEDGVARYVTALGTTDVSKGWRSDRLGGGVVIDVESGEVAISGLPMPHSPRLFDGKLYLVTAANGEVVVADPERGSFGAINRVPGFARGLAKYGDYVFVAHSKIRRKHLFGDLPIADADPQCGVTIIHLPSGAIAGMLRYHTGCEEIYDVHVLPGVIRPGILGVDSVIHKRGLQLEDTGYWAQETDESDDQATL
jgi:uncharacterized protein (TIGR03032 family)